MKIAVVGCCHGHFDKIYQDIADIEASKKIKIQLVLICGDVQTIRNPRDLQCMSVPEKYRKLGDFYRYYSGKEAAPILTIFIGGNHEASNYLQELPFGGWVAPNMYYLGLAGVVCYGALRIAGYSGIYSPRHYDIGHYETLPYSQSEMRSIYHLRSLDVFRLKLLDAENEQIDIFMSHDWPRGIWQYGKTDELLRNTSHFQPAVDFGSFGSIAGQELLHFLRPRFYFSGHMHCNFTAKIRHGLNWSSVVTGNREKTDPGQNQAITTRFMALDKAFQGRKYLEIIDIPDLPTTTSTMTSNSYDYQGAEPSLQLDPEWLCILKQTSVLWNSSPSKQHNALSMTRKAFDQFRPNITNIQEVVEDFAGDFSIPDNFIQTAPPFFDGDEDGGKTDDDSDDDDFLFFDDRQNQTLQPPYYLNPQTQQLCDKLKITNPCIEWALKANERLAASAENNGGNNIGGGRNNYQRQLSSYETGPVSTAGKVKASSSENHLKRAQTVSCRKKSSVEATGVHQLVPNFLSLDLEDMKKG